MSKVHDLIGIPYETMNCWDLVAKYHHIDLKLEKNVTTDAVAQARAIYSLTSKFYEIHPDELQEGDVILHHNHCALYINEGIIHSREPRSEFIYCTKKQAAEGLNGLTMENYRKPTFWRLKDDSNIY